MDKQVGIIGASHVGRHLVELLRPFALTTVVTDPFLTGDEADRLGVRRVELDELMRTCDVVSVHAPDLPSTRGMIGESELAKLRDGATLINTARPALVDADALDAELRTGRISAVLDVTDPEPLPFDAPLLGIAGAFVTPHIAGSGGTELARLADLAIDEVSRFANGDPPRHPVVESDIGRIA